MVGDDFEIIGASTVLLSATATAPPAQASTNKASLSAPQVAPYAMDGKTGVAST